MQRFLERRLAFEAEPRPRPAHIELAPWLAVGLARVPHNAPVEAGQAGDGFEQVFDADRKAAAAAESSIADYVPQSCTSCCMRFFDSMFARLANSSMGIAGK